MKRMTEADVSYVEANFVSLEEVCAERLDTLAELRALMEAQRLPMPSYILDDGREMVPPDYFALIDEAGGVDSLRERFGRRYTDAALAHGEPVSEAQVEKEWSRYLVGEYGVCLRKVTPENIFRKEWLVRRAEELLRLASQGHHVLVRCAGEIGSGAHNSSVRCATAPCRSRSGRVTTNCSIHALFWASES